MGSWYGLERPWSIENEVINYPTGQETLGNSDLASYRVWEKCHCQLGGHARVVYFVDAFSEMNRL